jgi:hypothetical protein
MEYWQFLDATRDKTCLISEINELDESIHWILEVKCNDRVFYVGMDFRKVEIVYKEVIEK